MTFYNHPRQFNRANAAHLSALCAALAAGQHPPPVKVQQHLRLGLSIHPRHLIATVHCQYHNTRQWATDLTALLTPWPQRSPIGRVHLGFLQDARVVCQWLLAAIRQYQHSGMTLWLTGHGCGAAVATLATAILLLEHDMEVQGLCTFGSPRCCDRAISATLEGLLASRLWRLVNDEDIITRLPPRCFGYRHVGELFYIDATGQLQLTAAVPWWDGFWDRCRYHGDWLFSKDISTIEEHSVETYAQFCERGKA